jgi:hypothetical protein
MQRRIALGLVVRHADRLGAGDQDPDGTEVVPPTRQAVEVERRLWKDDVDPLPFGNGEDLLGKCVVIAGRHEVEFVAEESANGTFRHIGPDQANLALAVRAKCADERRRPGRATGSEQNGDGAEAHDV